MWNCLNARLGQAVHSAELGPPLRKHGSNRAGFPEQALLGTKPGHVHSLNNIIPPEILSESQLDDEPGGLQVPPVIDEAPGYKALSEWNLLREAEVIIFGSPTALIPNSHLMQSG